MEGEASKPGEFSVLRSLRGRKLRRNGDFRFVFAKGKSVANRFYVIYVIRKPRQDTTRFGFSVSKKLGNAVMRNRVKRVLRESVRQHVSECTIGFDVVVIARKGAAELGTREAEPQVLRLLEKARVWKGSDSRRNGDGV